MRVLAVETSTLAGGVALLEAGRLVAEYVLDVSVTHSERLMAAVERALQDARWAAEDLQGLAVAVGPGSFTGLRIGVSRTAALPFGVAASATMSPLSPIQCAPLMNEMRSEWTRSVSSYISPSVHTNPLAPPS